MIFTTYRIRSEKNIAIELKQHIVINALFYNDLFLDLSSLPLNKDLSKTSQKTEKPFKFKKLHLHMRSFQIIIFAIFCK